MISREAWYREALSEQEIRRLEREYLETLDAESLTSQLFRLPARPQISSDTWDGVFEVLEERKQGPVWAWQAYWEYHAPTGFQGVSLEMLNSTPEEVSPRVVVEWRYDIVMENEAGWSNDYEHGIVLVPSEKHVLNSYDTQDLKLVDLVRTMTEVSRSFPWADEDTSLTTWGFSDYLDQLREDVVLEEDWNYLNERWEVTPYSGHHGIDDTKKLCGTLEKWVNVPGSVT